MWGVFLLMTRQLCLNYHRVAAIALAVAGWGLVGAGLEKPPPEFSLINKPR